MLALAWPERGRADATVVYQGRITNAVGEGVPYAELRVNLFDDPSATAPIVVLGPFAGVTFKDGIFSLPLGLSEPQLDALFGAGKRAFIQVLASLPDGTVLTLPRQELGAAPRALRVPVGPGLRFDATGQLVLDPPVPALTAPGAIGETNPSTVRATELRLPDADGTVVTIRSNAATPAAYALTLPASAGSSGQILTTNGSGALSWTSVASGVAGIVSSADATAVTITASEQIGIGTAAPQAPLHVHSTAGESVILNKTIAGSTNWLSLRTSGSEDAYWDGDRLGNTAGSAASPSYAFRNDTATGVYQPGGGQFGVSTAGVERLRIDGSGKVGIGTTSPISSLDVQSTATASTNLALARVGGTITNTGSFPTGLTGFAVKTALDASIGGNGAITGINVAPTFSGSGGGANTLIGIDIAPTWGVASGNAGNDAIGLRVTVPASTNSSYAALFNGGNVGIGTTAPEFHIDSRTTGAPDVIGSTSYGSMSLLALRSANGTSGSPAPTTILQGLGGIVFRGYGDTDFSTGGASILAVATENWSNGANGTKLVLQTTAQGASTAADRVTVAPNGNVGIGTTSPAAKLDVAGTIATGAGQAFKIRYGTSTYAMSNGPSIATSQAVTFGYTFNSPPRVFVTSTATAGWMEGVILSAQNTTTSGFSATFYNAGVNTAAGSYTFNWMAIGD